MFTLRQSNPMLYYLTMKQRTIREILLLINLSRISGRELLTAIFRFAEARSNWRIRVVQVQEHSPSELVHVIEDEHFDGIISSEMEVPDVASALERSTVPLSVIGTRRECIPHRTRSVAFCTYDDTQIGAFAANHFLHLGRFKTYAFVHYNLTRTYYPYLSMLRRKGFRKQLLKHGISSISFGDKIAESPEADSRALESWLLTLPKPCAILAAADMRAIEIVAVCNRVGLRIPDDISLLSIDNDEYLCLSVLPALTSVRTSIGDTGYEAARRLDIMMRARNKPKAPVRVILPASCEVVERESCRSTSAGVPLVARAKSYISDHARESITVRDVIAHLGVSRRLADLRFRESNGGKTILDEITAARLTEVAALLRTDTMSITQIAKTCGFSNPTYLKTLFKRKFGLTMRGYRALNAPSRP